MSCIATPTLKLRTLSHPIAPTFPSVIHKHTFYLTNTAEGNQEGNSIPIQVLRRIIHMQWRQKDSLSWSGSTSSIHRNPGSVDTFFLIAINSDEFLKFLAIRNLYVISINILELCLVSQNITLTFYGKNAFLLNHYSLRKRTQIQSESLRQLPAFTGNFVIQSDSYID